MDNLRLSPFAESDLENIWLYTYENWSLTQADGYYSQIVKALSKLVSGDSLGRMFELRKGYSKYKVGSHLIFYRHFNNSIEVVRILHQSVDYDRHL